MTLSLRADDDPTVPPCWRWIEAQRLNQDPGARASCDDHWLRKAIEHLRGNARCTMVRAGQRIFEADGVRRAEIESRILAGGTDQEVAEKCNVQPELVEAYEALFFAVRKHLHAIDWLTIQTIGPAQFHGFQQKQLRQLWAHIALSGGAIALNEAIRIYHQVAKPGRKPNLSFYLLPEAQASNAFQAMVASLVLPWDGPGGEWTMEFALRLRENRAITEPVLRAAANAHVQQAVIEIARQILSGRKLETPAQWKARNQEHSVPQHHPARGDGQRNFPHGRQVTLQPTLSAQSVLGKQSKRGANGSGE